jgi:uncharacterized protein (TIGR02611 family)
MNTGRRNFSWRDGLRFFSSGIDAMRTLWRALVFVVGIVVVAIGCALLVLPGPAFLVIPAGLAILSIEFEWARRWLHRVRRMTSNVMDRVRARSRQSSQS